MNKTIKMKALFFGKIMITIKKYYESEKFMYTTGVRLK